MTYLEQIKQAADFIASKISIQPEIGLVLGSGLGVLADEIPNAVKLHYENIPNFPVSTVKGHAGQLVIGELEGKQVIAMQGRFHYYEGYTMQQITFPVRVMKALGMETMIITNACGGLNPNFEAGSLMFIKDHLNLMGDNPLIGENFEELGTRFPDMTRAYNDGLIKLGKEQAAELGIPVFEGIHAAVSGPYYVSKAELKMVATLGADTIGMSTIPETIVAVHGRMKVLGISCITDMAVPDSEIEPLDHEMVMAMAVRLRPNFIRLVKTIIKAM